MNLPSIIVTVLIAILFIWALKHSLKNTSCDGDCSKCASGCSKSGSGTPKWVEEYRKDHPKQ